MKNEAKLFEGLAIFFAIMTVIYAFWAKEPVGITAMALSTGLVLFIGTFFRFVSRRLETRPEDFDDAQISDGSGELGFFSPGSYWPFLLAFAVALVALALAFAMWWLVAVAVIVLLLAVGGLVFEYHVGPEKH